MWKLLVLLAMTCLIWCRVVQRRWVTRRQSAIAQQLKTKIRAYPILGHTYKFFGTDEDRMLAWKEFGRDAIATGGISKILQFDLLWLCVADPAIAEVAMNQCLEKPDTMKVADIVVGNASIIAPVPIWRHRRKICAPTFNIKNLIQYVDIFSDHSIALADFLEKEVDNGIFSFWDYIVVCSINIVSETTLGVKIDFKGSEILKAIDELWVIAASIITSKPWFRNKYLIWFMPSYNTLCKHKNTIDNFLTEIITEKRKLLEDVYHTDIKYNISSCASFVDLQLEAPEGRRKLSEVELREEALQFVAAGFDTSSVNIAFVVLMLSRHADVQGKVHRELQEVFGDSDRAVAYEDLSRLKYLEAVIKETLRLYPPVPVVMRQVDNDVELSPGITAVKGCDVLVNIWAIHRNPAYWGEDAEKFRPERFLDYKPKHPTAFMPFSYGARGCPGYRYAMLLMMTTLATLLRRYRVLAPPGVPQGEPLRTKYEVITSHVDNYEIQLERLK